MPTYHFRLCHNTRFHESSYRFQLPLFRLSFYINRTLDTGCRVTVYVLLTFLEFIDRTQNKDRRNWFSVKITLMKKQGSGNIVVGIMSRLRAGCPSSRGSLPVRGKRCLLQCVQTGPCTHSAWCSMGTEGSSTGVKLTEGEFNTHPHLILRLRMSRAVTQLLRGLSNGAQGERYPMQIDKEFCERL
jgi:hypothetical protein